MATAPQRTPDPRYPTDPATQAEIIAADARGRAAGMPDAATILDTSRFPQLPADAHVVFLIHGCGHCQMLSRTLMQQNGGTLPTTAPDGKPLIFFDLANVPQEQRGAFFANMGLSWDSAGNVSVYGQPQGQATTLPYMFNTNANGVVSGLLSSGPEAGLARLSEMRAQAQATAALATPGGGTSVPYVVAPPAQGVAPQR